MKSLKATALRLSVATGVGEGLELGDALAAGVATGDFVLACKRVGLEVFVAGVTADVGVGVGAGVPDGASEGGGLGVGVGVTDCVGEGVGVLSGDEADCLICVIDPNRPEGV
jgi:hypothetical protein